MANDRVPPSGSPLPDDRWFRADLNDTEPAVDDGWDQWGNEGAVIGGDDDTTFDASAAPARAIVDEAVRRVRSSKPRRGIRSKGRRALRITLFVILAIVLIIAGGVTWAWFDLNSRIDQADIGDLLPTKRPTLIENTKATENTYPGDPFAGRAVNILVMGIDSREGANATVSGDDPGGSRPDTTFIAHVSADRTRVDVVSIPRDVQIYVPECLTPEGGTIDEAGWGPTDFNGAYGWAAFYSGGISTGAACAIMAVEEISGVYIDAFMVVDFAGFIGVVNAIGGFDITLNCPIYSPEAGDLDLPAGVIHLDGYLAVQVARARIGPGLGGGSDLERVARQQRLFDALLGKILSLNYVTDFPKLYELVRAGLESVTTNVGNLNDIAGFAYSLQNLTAANLVFETVPVTAAEDPNNVVILDYEAEPIWDALRNDLPLPGHEAVDPGVDPGAAPDPGATEVPVDPAATADPGAAGADPVPPAPPSIQSEYDCSW